MLRSLRISNFVLIEDTFIEFHSGLNVLTGETGAGKSIIIDALSLLLGERSSSEVVRNASKDAIVEAVFELDQSHPSYKLINQLLQESGIASEDEHTLIITRRISAEGRNRTFINQSQSLLKTLKFVSEYLVDLHGQHEHQSLFNKSSYQILLDRFGNNATLFTQYQNCYHQWRGIQSKLEALHQDARERKRQEDLLRYQRDEINAADLVSNEDEALHEKITVLQNAERLSEHCTDILTGLSEGHENQLPIIDQLDQLDTIFSEIAKYDSKINATQEAFQTAVISLKEVAREIESYTSTLDLDTSELEPLQERRFLIKDLKSKYGNTINDILQYRDTLDEQLEQIENFDETLSQLQQEEARLFEQLQRFAQDLHKKRKTNASHISKQVSAELNQLNMEQAQLLIQVTSKTTGADTSQPAKHYGPTGSDDIDFLISTIPDRPPRPLREIASGGEISRIMLALKCTFGAADMVNTMIFDEIDVGVGGKTADAIAERLARLSQQKQILCITHLPQIASRAQQNLKVEKTIHDGKAVSTISVLNRKEQELELARMLGGEDSAASLKFARELLKAAKN